MFLHCFQFVFRVLIFLFSFWMMGNKNLLVCFDLYKWGSCLNCLSGLIQCFKWCWLVESACVGHLKECPVSFWLINGHAIFPSLWLLRREEETKLIKTCWYNTWIAGTVGMVKRKRDRWYGIRRVNCREEWKAMRIQNLYISTRYSDYVLPSP